MHARNQGNLVFRFAPLACATSSGRLQRQAAQIRRFLRGSGRPPRNFPPGSACRWNKQAPRRFSTSPEDLHRIRYCKSGRLSIAHWKFIADFRLSADDAEAGAGNVAQHTVGLRQFVLRIRRRRAPGLHNRKPKAPRALCDQPGALRRTRSQETTSPRFSIRSARVNVLPPGAAQTSTTRSPGCGSRTLQQS